jgi:hypothetical protein
VHQLWIGSVGSFLEGVELVTESLHVVVLMRTKKGSVGGKNKQFLSIHLKFEPYV